MKTALSRRSFMRRRIQTKSLIIGLFLFTICYLLFANSVHAYETSNQTSEANYQNSDSNSLNNIDSNVPANMHSGAQILMLETMSALVCQLAGFDPITLDHRCLGVDPKTGKIGFTESGGGLITVMGRLIDYTFIPPASSTQYIAYLKNNFGVTKNAYAQTDTSPCANATTAPNGVGFCSLEPLLEIWVAMRNIVYLILILIFIAIGLGIMLRIHIDPRTVMTIQNQIPKIIIGILAISFSFAIAGLLIDVMWVSIYLFAGVIISATNPTPDGYTTLLDIVRSGNPFDGANAAFKIPSGNDNLGFDQGPLAIAEMSGKAFGSLIQGALEGKDDGGIFFDLIGGVISILAFVVILIIIIIALVRLWITLIFTYINIILDVILAPFWLLAGLIPGSSMGIGAWLKDLTANLAAFPVVISFFLLGNYLVMTYQGLSEAETVSRFSPPFIGGTNSTAIASLIGLGFILMLPNVVSSVKAAFKTPKLNFGPILSSVGPTVGGIAGIPKRGYHFSEKYQYNKDAGVKGWRKYTQNPLLVHKPSPMTEGGGTGGGKSAGHSGSSSS